MKKNKRLFHLLVAQHDGRELSEEELEELAFLLDDNEAALFSYFQIERMFHDLEAQYVGNCARTLIEEFPARRPKLIPMLGWTMAIAASLVIALLVVSRSGVKRAEMLVNEAATVLLGEEYGYVAHVINAEGVEWGEDNSVAIKNRELTSGMLDLKAGQLDIMFDNGARFAFDAPVVMDLSSLQHLSLESGVMAIHLPALAEEVKIKLPDGVLKAGYTHARIQCIPGTPTLVVVDEGMLSLYSENNTGHEVRKSMVGKERVEIARGAFDPFFDTQRLLNPNFEMPAQSMLENLQYVHYRFDEPGGRVAANTGTIPNAEGRLAGATDNPEYPAPRRVTGRFKRALEFTGHGEGMLADIKEFGSDEPGSVAFWIKMDPGVVPGKYENIFAWHMYTSPEKDVHTDDERELVCRIRINDSASSGVLGAIQIEFRNKWICGATDLRDGRWHHVTAVLRRDYYKNGVALLHYIDGKFAQCSARGMTWFPKERYPEIGGGSIAVGRNYWPKRPSLLPADGAVGLRGMVDELYVFNQPVLPSNISSLRMENTPNQVVDVVYVPWLPQTIGTVMLPRGSN